MEIKTKGINYQFSDSDGSTQSITISLSGVEAFDYITGSFVIKSSDLTGNETLDGLSKTQITNLGLKKMEAYIKETLGEA